MGGQCVLKAGVPRPDLVSEIEALRIYAGRGSVLLLQADAERGVMLLERIEPGTTLKAEPDDARATEIAARVMQSLWQPLPSGHSFKAVTDWAAGFKRLRARYNGGTGPLPVDRVALAESLFADLFSSAAPAVLLHGDLHHENILAGRRASWLAIDPQGIAGEPAYEVGALLRNPMPEVARWPDLARIQTPPRRSTGRDTGLRSASASSATALRRRCCLPGGRWKTTSNWTGPRWPAPMPSCHC